MKIFKLTSNSFKLLAFLFFTITILSTNAAENIQGKKSKLDSNSTSFHLTEKNCSNEFINSNAAAQINNVFKKYEIKTAVSNINHLQKKKGDLNLTIDLGTHGIFKLLLNSNELLSEKFKQKLSHQANKKDASIPLTYNGKIADQPGSKVALTISENFMSGFVEDGNTTIYFEPLSNFYPKAKPNELIIYNKNDVLKKKISCTHKHEPQSLKVADQQNNFKKSAAACSDYIVEIVLAADYGMYTKYGSTTAVRDQIISVLNAAQANYDNEFNDPITFKVVDYFISTSQAADLWSAETNADKLIKEFANSSFTTEIYDLASLWVTREIWRTEDGERKVKAGLAYDFGVCKSDQKFNLLSDYGANADYLRTTYAHEVGHNFGAAHDAAGTNFIMTPGFASNQWSTASLNKINSFYPTTNCLCNTQFVDLTAASGCGGFSAGGVTYKSMNVEHIGNVASVATKVGLFLSPDNDVNTDDYLVNTTTLSAMNPGERKSVQMALNFSNVDLACGDYYYGFVLDAENEIEEGSKSNNFGCIGTTNITDCQDEADLTIENCGSVTIDGNTITSGNITLKNIGGKTAPETFVGYYLSTNPTIDANDYIVAQSRFPELEPGASFSKLISKDISEVNNIIPAGTYYFGFLADRDNALSESNEGNNSCYDSNPRFTVTYGCKNASAQNYNPNATFNDESLCQNFSSCKQTDKAALMALYNSTDGANWTNPWNLSEPVENWEGVTLNAEGCVERLYFFNNNMKGSLPTEIGQLSKLKSLQLRYNGLSGNIPASIGDLSNLESLGLSTNKFIGKIPTTLEKLKKLKYLGLGSNALNGSIPANLGNLPKLETLSIYANGLTGKIPGQLGNLGNLKNLSIYSNVLTGNIPAQLGNLSKLQKMQLASNKLTGEIPSSFHKLDNLKELKLYNNQLNGLIPTELGDLEKLEELSLFSNQLTGSIPAQLGNLKNLEGLSLSSNQLTGTLPAGLGDLSNLEYMYIGRNDLTGCFADQLHKLCDIQNDINSGNNFYMSWKIFCENDVPVCLGGDRVQNNTNIETINYPNPFKTNTTIEFELPAESTISIKVYNSAGEQLVVLTDKVELPKGKNIIDFDGSKFPSGIYYYSIENNDRISMQKMILMK